jgi:glycosyltransferase involved in cell wall biosynthesis
MSKIVIDCREIKTSSGRYVERLIHYLQKIDKTNTYYALLKPSDFDDWTFENKSFNKVLCGAKEFTWSEQTKLKEIIEELKPDLTHFTFAQQPAFYKGKRVTTIHDLTTLRFDNPDKNILVFRYKQKVYAWLIKRVVKKSKQVIVPSNFVKQDLIRFTNVSESKVNVIYEAADKITEKPKTLDNLVGKKFIMYIGRPTPHKNLERLIEAFIKLKQDDKDLCLVLAGKEDNNYREIRDKVENKGYKDIVFTGYISDAELRWLYENCQAYVFPSLSEGFGLPGLEAMVHGAPVVSSKATCLPEVYGEAAEYFDPLDVGSIGSAISNVLVNKERKQQLIELGFKQASKYSWGKMAQQTLDVYKKALEDN